MFEVMLCHYICLKLTPFSIVIKYMRKKSALVVDEVKAVIFIVLSLPLASNENNTLKDVLTYLKNFNEFTSSFLQIQNNDISEGLIYKKGK